MLRQATRPRLLQSAALSLTIASLSGAMVTCEVTAQSPSWSSPRYSGFTEPAVAPNGPAQRNSAQPNSGHSINGAFPAGTATVGSVRVPRSSEIRSVPARSATTSDGWKLNWRPNKNAVTQAPATQASATQRPATQRPTVQATASNTPPTASTNPQVSATVNQPGEARIVGGLQVATEPPTLRAVKTVGYAGNNAQPNSLVATANVYQNQDQPAYDDFFSNPFGDESAAAADAATQVPGTPQGMTFPPTPDPAAAPALPADSRSMNQLRQQVQDVESGGAMKLPSQELPAQELPAPGNPANAAQDDGPSISEYLRNERPDPIEQAPNRLPQMDNDQSADSPSDQGEFEDPFRDRQSNDGDRNRADRDKKDDYDTFDLGDDNERYGGKTALTCNDFRERIRSQTIDQVSLDISPPFRPDEIDQDRYEKLKARFDERQEIRQWRSIDGTPLAKGRLRDLAYQRVVIETDFGTTEQLPIERLSEGDLAYISENWGLPKECRIEQVAYTPRSWKPITMTWKASNLCHNPLYFEDVNLERYGHTHGPVLEPIVQTAHFFGNIAVLPYKMGVHCPTECQYALGYYRPGNCAPWIKPPVPLSLKGAYSQAAAMTGLIWLVP